MWQAGVLIRRRSLDGMGLRGNSLAMTNAGGAHMSRRSLRPGRVISGLPVLVFSAMGKLHAQPELVQAFTGPFAYREKR